MLLLTHKTYVRNILLACSFTILLPANPLTAGTAYLLHNTIQPIHRVYRPHITLGGFYQNSHHLLGAIDLFMPSVQTNNTLLFIDVRGISHSGTQLEGNFGLGYRQMNLANTWLWGVYGFYDLKRSRQKNLFKQITLGGEIRNTHWSLRVNGYLPVGNTEKSVAIWNQAHVVNNDQQNGSQNIVYHDGREKALAGVNSEIGWDVSWLRGLTIYGGGYYFSAADV
ncbi:MAG: inverse autotransporter beta domain-containing protein, partial [Gammaproteobacteria bacterium]|nr:inverse autotransporter beta domain-containing protein [Gammaproteobacteria bacterium]